jgi:hypothetical protein
MRAVARQASRLRASVARPIVPSTSRTSIAATQSIRSYKSTPPSANSFARKQVANMSSKSTQSEACCNTPAVVSKGYSPKGDYIEVDGLKTCMSQLLHLHHNTVSPPQTPRAPRMQSRVSWSSTTSSASSTRPSKAPTSSPTPTISNTKSSCPISSRASPQTSHGTLRTTTRRARSWASSSTIRPRRPRRCRVFRRLWRSWVRAGVLRSGRLLGSAGVGRYVDSSVMVIVMLTVTDCQPLLARRHAVQGRGCMSSCYGRWR